MRQAVPRLWQYARLPCLGDPSGPSWSTTIIPFLGPDVIAALGALVSGGASMPARANAARAVGILRGNAAVPDLVQALRTKDTDVLYESLIAMQKIRDESVGPQIA